MLAVRMPVNRIAYLIMSVDLEFWASVDSEIPSLYYAIISAKSELNAISR